MRSFCPTRSTALMPRSCNRGCRGFECREREDRRKAVLEHSRAAQGIRDIPILTDVVEIANFNPEAPVHPSMQNDAWDEWKPNRDIQ